MKTNAPYTPNLHLRGWPNSRWEYVRKNVVIRAPWQQQTLEGFIVEHFYYGPFLGRYELLLLER